MPSARTRHRIFHGLAAMLAAATLVAPGPGAAQAKPAFEPAPTLAGSELAPASLLKGPLHTVAEPVHLDGYFGRFVIESKFGSFTVLGVNMLGVRVNELQAIEALQQVQQSQAFQDALARSAAAPVRFAQSAVTNPVQTVENVGQGLGTVLGRIGFLAQSGIQSVADASADRSNPPPPSQAAPPPDGESVPTGFMGDPFGFNRARREWAKSLNVDPYTTNPVLRPLLDQVAAASFAGSFAVNTALGAVSMPANLVVEFDTTVRDQVWNQPASDLARQNEATLLGLGVAGRTTRDFLRNRWFTPSLQTALVTALAKFGAVDGMEAVIRVASEMQGETRARFLIESVRMLAQYHAREARITKLRMSNLVPVAVAADGTLVAAAAVDYVYWDRNTAEFAQRPDLKAKRRVLLVAGTASPAAQQAFAKAGLALRTGGRP
ncbi:MAG: hypothetical protein U1F58_09330 [Burkholderiales bacterium]